MLRGRTPDQARCDRWLVVAAFAPELAFLKAALPRFPAQIRQRVTLETVGIGLVEAAIGASVLFAKEKPQAVVLVGTAGVYPAGAHRFPLGQAVLAGGIVLLPEILPGKHAYLPDLVPTRQEPSPALARSLHEATGLPLADVACPLAITKSKLAAETAARLSGCALENLEAFAVARAAACAGIPFAAVLGIANRVGPNGHREWKRHGQNAAAAACSAVADFLLRCPLHTAARGK